MEPNSRRYQKIQTNTNKRSDKICNTKKDQNYIEFIKEAKWRDTEQTVKPNKLKKTIKMIEQKVIHLKNNDFIIPPNIYHANNYTDKSETT